MCVHKSLVQATFVQDTIASPLSTCNSITDAPQTLYISAHSIRTFIVFLSKYILENNTGVFFYSSHIFIYVYVKQRKKKEKYFFPARNIISVLYLHNVLAIFANTFMQYSRTREKEREREKIVHYTICKLYSKR